MPGRETKNNLNSAFALPPYHSSPSFSSFSSSIPSLPQTTPLTLTHGLISLLKPHFIPLHCRKCPPPYLIIANRIEDLKYPFIYSLSDFGNLADKPHKNIVRMLKGKPFRKPDISATIQEDLEGMKGKSNNNGLVVDVGANVGMASFAAAGMGFRVLGFEPVFDNLQRICDGIWFKRVEDLVTIFEAAVSDRIGNVTFHKCCCSNGWHSSPMRKLHFK